MVSKEPAQPQLDSIYLRFTDYKEIPVFLESRAKDRGPTIIGTESRVKQLSENGV
jgi:hypothetical protein